MKKTPLVITFVLILLGFLWITFNIFDLVLEDSETTIEATIETTTFSLSETTSEAPKSTETPTSTEAPTSTETYTYMFRYQDLYDQHFEKHGHEFGDITKEDYLKIANDLFTSDDALRKTESDGDLLFYDVVSNTFGVLSQDGYIRTCFKPDDGIDYWNRQ